MHGCRLPQKVRIATKWLLFLTFHLLNLPWSWHTCLILYIQTEYTTEHLKGLGPVCSNQQVSFWQGRSHPWLWIALSLSTMMSPFGRACIVQRFYCSLFKKLLYKDFRTMDGFPKLKEVHMSTWHATSTRAEPFSFVSVKFATSSFNSCVRAVQTQEGTWSRLVNSIGLLTTCDRQLWSWHAHPFLLCRWSLRPFRSCGANLLASCTV